MQDIHEESLNEAVKSAQSARVVLWEIDLTAQGANAIFSAVNSMKRASLSPGRGVSIRHTR